MMTKLFPDDFKSQPIQAQSKTKQGGGGNDNGKKNDDLFELTPAEKLAITDCLNEFAEAVLKLKKTPHPNSIAVMVSNIEKIIQGD